MNIPERYESDVLFFFEGRADALGIYEALFRLVEREFPPASVRVQKSQISFYGRRLFAMASLPKRRGDGGIVLSFGLGSRLPSPRVAVAVEPYPGRWTHHVPVKSAGELDGELTAWLRAAWAFSETKGAGT